MLRILYPACRFSRLLVAGQCVFVAWVPGLPIWLLIHRYLYMWMMSIAVVVNAWNQRSLILSGLKLLADPRVHYLEKARLLGQSARLALNPPMNLKLA